MQILAIADKKPEHSLIDLLKNNPIDLIVTLGDLDYFMLQELESVTNIPKIGVYGNHCSGSYFQALGIQNMHLQVWEFQGVRFGGLQGCVRYKDNPLAIMNTQEEVAHMLENFPPVDVFLSHCPPYGINDELSDPEDVTHQGFRALRDYLDRHHPHYLLHGHTYPTPETLITEYQSTHIIYVHREKILTI